MAKGRFWNSQALRDWDINRLLTNLEIATKRKYRHNTRQEYLCALLQGSSLDEISRKLHKNYGVVRADVCNIYRDIEYLTQEPDNSVRAINLARVLEKHGYRISRPLLQNRQTLSNLPAPNYTEFIGRKTEMSLLLKRISPKHASHIVTVDGIGGVGKTALVLEAARRCLKAKQDNPSEIPVFDAIIFTSAKQRYLFPSGIVPKPQAQRNLHDIVREVANILDIQASLEDQLSCVRQALAHQNVLLIVDNMETMEDEATNHVLAFLYDLPANVKVVITSRERLGIMPISLPCLSRGESLRLIQQQANEKRIPFSRDESKLLYDRTGGVPIAIVYSIGQVSNGYPLESVLERLSLNEGDIAEFCFKESVQKIQGRPAHALLMALVIFPEPPGLDAIATVAGLSSDSAVVRDGLAKLQQLSLINQKDGRYGMLALTREYVLAELKANPAFEQAAREQWIAWHIHFVEQYGGEDWKRWIQYDKLKTEEGNLLAVLYWCKDQERYENVRDLLLLLNHYVNLYGYWDDQMDWLQWLLESAERRGDWATFIKIVINKSWLLTRRRSEADLQEANQLLDRALSLHEYADYKVRADLIEGIVRLRIRQKKFKDARNWLEKEEKYVIKADLEGQQHIRYFIPIRYHQAEICFWEGNYLAAKQRFQEVLEGAAQINWHRVLNSAQNWLADIAIRQGDWVAAKKLLEAGLPVAEKNGNKRRLARYHRSYAMMERAQGNREKAQEYADKAIDSFHRLGMAQDVEEMQHLIQESDYC